MTSHELRVVSRAPSAQAEMASRSAELARERAEWRPWLAVLDATIQATADPAWEHAASVSLATQRPQGAPGLAEAVVRLDPRLARDWTRRLLTLAARGGSPLGTANQLEPLALLEAVADQEPGRLGELAAEAGADPEALVALAPLLCTPLLHACARRVSPDAAWRHGYCPLCGAWPTLAELRGLERARRLRCGRCGADWGFDPLRCVFCGVADFKQLGSLVPEADPESRKVDTCSVCKGYVKALATLVAWPGPRLALEDLATVELDLAALERGFSRPGGTGYPLRLRLEPAAPRRGLLGWRR